MKKERGIHRAGVVSASVLAAAALAVAACGGDSPSPAPSSGASAGTSTGDETRNDLTREAVADWVRYERVSSNQLRFFFWSGDKRCYGSRVVVRETSTTIEVATIVGTLPDAPEACTDVGRQATVLVTTREAIGDREIRHLTNVKLRK